MKSEHEKLLKSLRQAESDARTICEKTGKCRQILNRLRESIRETDSRVRAYAQVEKPKAPRAPETPKETPKAPETPKEKNTFSEPPPAAPKANEKNKQKP